MNTRIESLHMVETACWRELERATHEREHEWRVMTLATVAGDRAEARSVILRDVRADPRTLLFYSDARSPKLEQIRAHPKGTLLGWSSLLSWQIRLRVHLEPEDDGLNVSSRWARLKLSPAAKDYLSPLAPGEPLTRPGAGTATARDYFTIVSARVEAIDWVELHADGHRRACFDAEGPRWVQP
jgi:hypothetical protein